jgi:LPXTG-motif cell wall-anchored protein
MKKLAALVLMLMVALAPAAAAQQYPPADCPGSSAGHGNGGDGCPGNSGGGSGGRPGRAEVAPASTQTDTARGVDASVEANAVSRSGRDSSGVPAVLGDLPRTGGGIATLVVVGLGSLALGGVAVRRTRRSRTA